MAQTPFPISAFQLANGTAVSNGRVVINLSKDATATTGPIAAKIKVSVKLDINGEITSTPPPQFWPNSELEPEDTYYIYQVYNGDGQPITGPLYVTIIDPGIGFGESFGNSFGS